MQRPVEGSQPAAHVVVVEVKVQAPALQLPPDDVTDAPATQTGAGGVQILVEPTQVPLPLQASASVQGSASSQDVVAALGV